MILKKFASYLAFWKKRKSDEPTSFNLKVMHGINRISIIIFLIALVIIVVKFFIL